MSIMRDIMIIVMAMHGEEVRRQCMVRMNDAEGGGGGGGGVTMMNVFVTSNNAYFMADDEDDMATIMRNAILFNAMMRSYAYNFIYRLP